MYLRISKRLILLAVALIIAVNIGLTLLIMHNQQSYSATCTVSGQEAWPLLATDSPGAFPYNQQYTITCK